MTESPHVTVVVATRDRPQDLEACLAAVLASTHRDFELIVVDQSTQPTSAALVERFAEQDGRVRLVHVTQPGAARARNLGARLSTSELIVFTDDDCRPEP